MSSLRVMNALGLTRTNLALLLGCFVVSSMYIFNNTVSTVVSPSSRAMKSLGSPVVSISQSSAINAIEDHERKVLPSFENGGVIFFLHVPKSGGVTVRRALGKGFKRNPGAGRYFLADRKRKLDKYKHAITQYTKYGTDNNELVVLELHAADSPTLMEVAERLTMWRTRAAKYNVPFFAFTVLREPMSFAVSFFNFYYGMDHGDPNYKYYEVASEKDFTRTAVFNPQCGFLVKSDDCFLKKEAKKLTHEECNTAYNVLVDNLDWIGTTERLSNETFPLLRSIVGTNMNADHLLPQNIKKSNMSPKKIVKEELSPRAVEYIQNLTIWDQEMYEKTTADFRFERMVVEDGATI